MGDILKTMYEGMITFVETINDVWDWINPDKPHWIGLEWNTGLFDWTFRLGFNFHPLQSLMGAGIITLIGFLVVKKLVPLL